MRPAGSRWGRRFGIALVSVAVTMLLGAPAAGAANRIYWSNDDVNSISYANLDGSGGKDLNTGDATVFGPMGLAIDPAAGKIYWANWGYPPLGTGTTISWANLNGSGGGDLPIAPGMVNGPHGLAIDPIAGKIYWPNFATDTISYANLDGSGAANLTTTGATVKGPRGVAIDPAARRIYWANYGTGTGTTISYAKLNGSGGHDLVTTGATVEGPEGVALDPAAGRIYWGNYGPGDGDTIAYANLDGSGHAHNLPTAPVVPNRPHGVALDPAAERIYWPNYGSWTISYANLDGSGGANIPTTGATVNGPDLPALLEVPAAAGAPRISGGSTAGSKLSCSRGRWASDLVTALLYRAPRSFSYQWTLDGRALPGANSNSITASSPASIAAWSPPEIRPAIRGERAPRTGSAASSSAGWRATSARARRSSPSGSPAPAF